ncbi:molybdopterin-dependent oxidoreductase [Tessaracoccus antarcticus]|uniref:molybdopterin-dependent oxidoreductase n=1 Tax=Tessaracoccus antarcticus TaxID=2479848 RepID=UPI00131439AB|nr:molybdopterin-dependent oxidoreductase [Tessaracoccus antarcticus]
MKDPSPGQRVLIGPAPRFGLPQYLAARFTIPEGPVLEVGGLVDHPITLDRAALDAVPGTTKALDLHCVMTWSAVGTRWSGWRFSDLWDTLLRDPAEPGTVEVLFTGLDGFTASIPLEELLRDDVMIAHSRDGRPLERDHGAPYRLVVPQLYGYKHVKHLCRIDLVDHHVRSPHEPWIMHRIGRVAREERFGVGMRWLVRLLARATVRPTLRRYDVPDPQFERTSPRPGAS